VTAFDQLGSLDPSGMVIPTTTTRADQVPCQPNQVLALYAAQFNPSPARGNAS